MFEHETAREYRKVLRLSSRFTLKNETCEPAERRRNASLSCLQSFIYLCGRIAGKPIVRRVKGVSTAEDAGDGFSRHMQEGVAGQPPDCERGVTCNSLKIKVSPFFCHVADPGVADPGAVVVAGPGAAGRVAFPL